MVMVKMRIKGILYTGKTVYECLCKAVREPIDIHAKMVDVNKTCLLYTSDAADE